MNKIALKTAIIISWIVLAVCFIIKLFGGKCFEIATSNSTFNKVCEFVDNHLWLQNIVAFCTTLLAVCLVNLAVLKQRTFNIKQFAVVIICTIVEFVAMTIGDYLNNIIINIVAFILGFVPVCICPMILSKKPLRSILACVLYMAFQALSMVVKGLSIAKVNNDGALISLIFSIDVYIMLILFYLHANLLEDNKKNKIQEKGDTNNG